MNLTAKDVADLERIESEIEQDQASFFRMAENLITIRDRKLYLRDYKNFESYCQLRWGWSRQWVNQQIRTAEVVRRLPEKTLETLVSNVVSPLTESVARALNSVPEKERPEVVEHAATKPEPVTARSISESAKVVANGKPEPAKQRDFTGWVIPEQRLEIFQRGNYVEEILGKLASVRGFVRRMQESTDPLFSECNCNNALVELDSVYANLKRAVPYAVCSYCQGILSDSCTACRGRGVVSKHFWDAAVPEEHKIIRQRTLEDKRND